MGIALRRERLKQIAAGLMVLVMAVLLLNNSAYLHVHAMPDGSLVAHAHPFDKSGQSKPEQAHHHKHLECQMLQDLQVLFLLSLTSTVLLLGFRKASRLLIFQEKLQVLPLLPTGGRAPPVLYS